MQGWKQKQLHGCWAEWSLNTVHTTCLFHSWPTAVTNENIWLEQTVRWALSPQWFSLSDTKEWAIGRVINILKELSFNKCSWHEREKMNTTRTQVTESNQRPSVTSACGSIIYKMKVHLVLLGVKQWQGRAKLSFMLQGKKRYPPVLHVD